MSAPAIERPFKSSPGAGLGGSVLAFERAPEFGLPPLCNILLFRTTQRGSLDWMTKMYRLVDRNEIDDALEVLYDEMLELQTAGRFGECDEMLALIDVEGLDTNLMVGVLSVTFQARDKLRNRDKILQKIERRLAQLAPTRVEALIGGLR